MNRVKVFYRLSDKGKHKEKLTGINNVNCLKNFLNVFPAQNVVIVADNVSEDTYAWLTTLDVNKIHRITLGNTGSFWRCFELALELDDEEKVYFVENDYIHLPGALEVLMEGLEIGDYVTLYDHPDKYIDGFNPDVKNGGEYTKVYLTKSVHWKQTNSTTMTFAGHVKTLRKDKSIFRKCTIDQKGIFSKLYRRMNGKKKLPFDYEIFKELTKNRKRILLSSIPAYSTHGEVKFLSPLVKWAGILDF